VVVEQESGIEGLIGRVALRIAAALDSDLEDVLAEITRGLTVDLHAALARIWLIEPTEASTLRLVASAGLSERIDGAHARVPIGELKIGEIAQSRTAVTTNDLLGDPRFVDKEWIREHALLTFAGYPLIFKSELLGVLAMFGRRPMTDSEIDALSIFAAHCSVAIKNARLARQLEAENRYLKEELGDLGPKAPAGIVGQSEAIARVLRELERVAPTSSNVLLFGETGTGKELFARAVHQMSARKNKPLVKVSAAAFAPTLIESELFGHEKGAFTGAVARHIGRFELAHGGTLFLDEIGELPLDLQAKLLRVLQEHEIERVGGTKPIRVDVRIVAATNRDLAAEARANRFRSDLYFRLNVFPIVIPPLRDRREDIPSIALDFLRTLGAHIEGTSLPTSIDDDALTYLQSYDWPGNVRELQNVLERAAILARGRSTSITLADLPELRDQQHQQHQNASVEEGSGSPKSLPLKQRLQAFERTLIADALRDSNGNQSEAARLLGTTRTALQYKMKLFGLS
jgi:transcriptional regulator with GAF, ATPase, and Fis domain